jgi:hypothetical protein
MVVKTAQASTRSAGALAKDDRSVLMKGIDRRFHPKILRFSSHLVAGINPIATPADADSVTSPGPPPVRQAASDAWSRYQARLLRPDLGYRIQVPAAT